MKVQVAGLFCLKKNSTILSRVLGFSHAKVLQSRNLGPRDTESVQRDRMEEKAFYEMIEVVNSNLDDTIDLVR